MQLEKIMLSPRRSDSSTPLRIGLQSSHVIGHYAWIFAFFEHGNNLRTLIIHLGEVCRTCVSLQSDQDGELSRDCNRVTLRGVNIRTSSDVISAYSPWEISLINKW